MTAHNLRSPLHLLGRLPASLGLIATLLVSSLALAQTPGGSTAPLEAYTDPGWTGQAQPASILRKEAAAALQEGRRGCAGEPKGVSRNECLKVVNDDYRLMLAKIKASPRR